jgi:hypothetical protein
MKNIETRYWLTLGLVTAALAASIWIVFSFMLPDYYPRILPVFLVMVALITLSGQILLTQALRKDPKKFQSWYLIYKSLKMLIIMAFMLIYVFVNRKNGVAFLGSVFVIYLVYMIFESASLNRAARKETEN